LKVQIQVLSMKLSYNYILEVALTQIREPLESKPWEKIWNMMLGSLNNQVELF